MPHRNTDSPRPTDEPTARPDAERHIGAVEGDRPSDQPQQGNPNADGLDDQGLPDDPVGIAEDVIGANEDETTG